MMMMMCGVFVCWVIYTRRILFYSRWKTIFHINASTHQKDAVFMAIILIFIKHDHQFPFHSLTRLSNLLIIIWINHIRSILITDKISIASLAWYKASTCWFGRNIYAWTMLRFNYIPICTRSFWFTDPMAELWLSISNHFNPISTRKTW